MIAEYHLACATRGSMTTSPILPEAVEQYLPPLVDYACPGSTGLTDVRVCDHKASSLRMGVWLHRVDMSLSWEREASESLVQSRHIRAPLLSYLLAPRTSNLCFEEVVSRVLQENWGDMRGQRRGSGPHSIVAAAGRPGSHESSMRCPRGWKPPQTQEFGRK